MVAVFRIALALAGVGVALAKSREALRSRKCNRAGGKAAKLPQSLAPYAGSEAAVRDDTGAIVRALEVSDDIELYVREFDIEGGVVQKGTVVLVHGLTYHSAYFKQFANILNEQGYVVYTYDLRGHGLSGRVDGIPGFVRRWRDHVDDALAVLDFTESRHPGVPCFIFGESMGGAIVFSLLADRAEEGSVRGVKGAMFAAPALRVVPSLLPPAPVILILRLVRLLFPKLPMPNNLNDTFDDAFGDKDQAAASRADPLVLFNAPRLQFAMSALSAMSDLRKKARNLQVPWVILHGALDVRTELSMSQDLYLNSTCKDKTLKQYPDACHQLFQDKQDVAYRAMNDFVTWLLDRS